MKKKFIGKTGRCLAAVLTAALLLAETPGALPPAGSVTVEASVKKGLKKEKGKYYYYVNGKKVTKTWKSVKVKGRKYRYYFGKSGAAYAGKKKGGLLVLSKKKIGKAYYAFDASGHMVKGLHYISGKFWYFNSKGKYDAKRTKTIRSEIRKASGYLSDYAPLKEILGKYGFNPVKTEKEYGCFAMENVSGMDGTDTYSEFRISYFLGDNGQSYLYSID